MGIPNKRRAEFAQERIEQIYAAAEAGEGWVKLGLLWGVTNSCALQWSQTRVPSEVWKKIGQNGQKCKGPSESRRRYNHSKPKVEHFTPRATESNTRCRRKRLELGKLVRCNADSNGHDHCEGCRHELAVQHSGSNYRNHALIGVVSR